MRARDFWVEIQVDGDQREEHLILAASEHAAIGQARAMPGIDAVV